MEFSKLARLWRAGRKALSLLPDAAGKSRIFRFFRDLSRNSAFYIVIMAGLGLICGGDFFFRGMARRTFCFYALDSKQPVIEERLLPRSAARQDAVEQYVREFILGPIPANTAALFHPRTVLQSLIVDGQAVYINLSEEAVLPADVSGYGKTAGAPDGVPSKEGAGGLDKKLDALRTGVLVNFPALKTVMIFAGGYRLGA